MRRLERVEEQQEALLTAARGNEADLWTSIPAIVQSFDPAAITVVAQPAIQIRKLNADGTETWVRLPLLLDVPVQFPQGGIFVHTFPIAPGDEVLIQFSARCIDNWFQSGGVQVQSELRMHDLNDGFAIPGVRSRPRPLAGGVSTTATQLRTVDGECYIEITEDGKARVQAVDVEVHASHSYSWDVNGFGERVTYEGANTWNVHKWQTPRPGDTVTVTNTAISPPEGP